MSSWIRRPIEALFVIVLALFAAQAAGIVSAPTLQLVHSYVYDGQRDLGAATYTAIERGPPASYAKNTTHDAVDAWSRGASAHPDRAAPTTTYTYDHPAVVVPAAGVATASKRQVGEADGDPSLVPLRAVAAKSGDEFLDLASASRRRHILDGEVRPNGSFGGGHRPRRGSRTSRSSPAGGPTTRSCIRSPTSRPIHP
jgi:hypothetical protein